MYLMEKRNRPQKKQNIQTPKVSILQYKMMENPPIQFAPPTDEQTLNHIFYGLPINATTVVDVQPTGLHAYGDVTPIGQAPPCLEAKGFHQ